MDRYTIVPGGNYAKCPVHGRYYLATSRCAACVQGLTTWGKEPGPGAPSPEADLDARRPGKRVFSGLAGLRGRLHPVERGILQIVLPLGWTVIFDGDATTFTRTGMRVQFPSIPAAQAWANSLRTEGGRRG